MPRYSRNCYRKNKPYSKKRTFSKTGAKDQAKQIFKLQKDYAKLRKSTERNATYSLSGAYSSLTHGLLPNSSWHPHVKRAIQPNNWIEIFAGHGDSASDASRKHPREFRGEYVFAEHHIMLGDAAIAATPVTFTLYTVSLKPETAKQTKEHSNDLDDLQPGYYFNQANMGAIEGTAMVHLNDEVFTIRAPTQRFTIGAQTNFIPTPDETKTVSLEDNRKRIVVKVPWKNKIVESGTTHHTYKEMHQSDLNPADQLYFLLFHNAYGDQTVSWHSSYTIRGKETS
ncbi:MAG: putative capsid protein [Cressdnaviricota sp.]|nr:MAG: putative capsid protein [Cressdnaviricota sp.]